MRSSTWTVPAPSPPLRALRGLNRDLVELRRGDHSGTRLKLEQERLGRSREKTEEEVIAHFQSWLDQPGVRDLACQNWVDPEERKRRLRIIFGLPEFPAGHEAAEGKSNPVKPSQTHFA